MSYLETVLEYANYDSFSNFQSLSESIENELKEFDSFFTEGVVTEAIDFDKVKQSIKNAISKLIEFIKKIMNAIKTGFNKLKSMFSKKEMEETLKDIDREFSGKKSDEFKYKLAKKLENTEIREFDSKYKDIMTHSINSGSKAIFSLDKIPMYTMQYKDGNASFKHAESRERIDAAVKELFDDYEYILSTDTRDMFREFPKNLDISIWSGKVKEFIDTYDTINKLRDDIGTQCYNAESKLYDLNKEFSSNHKFDGNSDLDSANGLSMYLGAVRKDIANINKYILLVNKVRNAQWDYLYDNTKALQIAKFAVKHIKENE